MISQLARPAQPHGTPRAPALTFLLIAYIGAAPSARADAPARRATAPVELHTTDTLLTVRAGEHAPQLTRLGFRGETPWRNQLEETLPARAETDGVSRPLTWRLDRAATRVASDRVEFVYESASPRLQLIWRWRARASFGPIEHDIEIRNLGGQALWLPLLPSWRAGWRIDPEARLERLWIEKGADAPSAVGTHLDQLLDGDRWEGTSSSYARPIAGEPRETIPWVLLEERGGKRRGWYLGIEFSGRTHIALERRGRSLLGAAGLNPRPGPYRTRLLPGASFTTPTVLVGAFAGGPDAAGNILHRWVRTVLNNPRTTGDPAYPLLVSNSWGSGMAVDEKLARRMIEEAAALGLDMFHLDAGWYRAVGDWRADAARFPSGLAALADFAHAHGIRFGLWVSWGQAGVSKEPGALRIDDPVMRDWLIADPPLAWKAGEPFKGITIDLGVPAAAAWAERELERIVDDYHLDMLEHDGYLVAQGSARANHPASFPEPGTLRVGEDSGYVWVEGSNSTDVSDYATRAYYRIQERLRALHPTLLLELCNDGGRMVDYGSAARGDYFSMTDVYDPLANRRAFFDASHVLPPAMLESYVAGWPTPRLANFRYLLRSGMLGWFSLMLDSSRWTEEQRADARSQFAIYAAKLRPLIRTADLYHVSERPDGVHWDGFEYYSPALRRGVLYAFRGSVPDEPRHRFRLVGLDPRGRYNLTLQDRGPPSRVEWSGLELMRRGVEVSLDVPLSSELVFFEIPPARAAPSRPTHTDALKP